MTEVEKSGKHETVIGNSREKFGIGGINKDRSDNRKHIFFFYFAKTITQLLNHY